MKAKVDKDMCTGCELCAQSCPEVFKMTEGKAEAYISEIPQDFSDKCKEAAEGCPVDAIVVE
jgi:ferredoxin